jgi:hypothetical protein
MRTMVGLLTTKCTIDSETNGHRGRAGLDPMRSTLTRWPLAIGFGLMMAGCGGGQAPGTPSGPSTQPTIVAGVWTGAVGLSADDGRSLGLVWNAEPQGDGRLIGTATLSTLPSSPAQMSFAGMMTSVRSGNSFLLTYSSGSSSANAPRCSASATGTAHLENFTLVGDLEVTYQSCDDLPLQPPASTHLELLRKLD